MSGSTTVPPVYYKVEMAPPLEYTLWPKKPARLQRRYTVYTEFEEIRPVDHGLYRLARAKTLWVDDESCCYCFHVQRCHADGSINEDVTCNFLLCIDGGIRNLDGSTLDIVCQGVVGPLEDLCNGVVFESGDWWWQAVGGP